MGKLDLDELVHEDAASVAKTVAKCALPQPSKALAGVLHGIMHLLHVQRAL